MKNFKLLFVFLAFAGLASCSSDDDANPEPPANDPIVGKWQIQQQRIDGEEFPLSDCEKQSTVEFMTNGSVMTEDFYEDDDTEECVSDEYTEQWVNRGNNVYRISDGGQSYDVTITFSNNNNTFTVSVEDIDGSYSTTYVRV